MLKKVLFIILRTPFLCFAGTDAPFVGKWVHIKYPSLRLEVSQNGPDMLITAYKEKSLTSTPPSAYGRRLRGKNRDSYSTTR